MKNDFTNAIEKKVFCFFMDLPTSKLDKKEPPKMKNDIIDDHYSF